jgi:carbonic anhydrase
LWIKMQARGEPLPQHDQPPEPARKNVEMTMATIRKDSPVLVELETKHMIKIAGAMYNLGTGAVEFFG